MRIGQTQTENHFDQAKRALECRQKYVVDPNWLLAETTHVQVGAEAADDATAVVAAVGVVQRDGNWVTDSQYRWNHTDGGRS